MSQALEDGGLAGRGGGAERMDERGCAGGGELRAGAEGQGAERADAAVVHQSGGPGIFEQ